jgi:hypothetical protein
MLPLSNVALSEVAVCGRTGSSFVHVTFVPTGTVTSAGSNPCAMFTIEMATGAGAAGVGVVGVGLAGVGDAGVGEVGVGDAGVGLAGVGSGEGDGLGEGEGVGEAAVGVGVGSVLSSDPPMQPAIRREATSATKIRMDGPTRTSCINVRSRSDP